MLKKITNKNHRETQWGEKKKKSSDSFLKKIKKWHRFQNKGIRYFVWILPAMIPVNGTERQVEKKNEFYKNWYQKGQEYWSKRRRKRKKEKEKEEREWEKIANGHWYVWTKSYITEIFCQR